MMKVYKIADNVITSLGFTTEENYLSMLDKRSGIRQHSTSLKEPASLYMSLVDEALLQSQWQPLENGALYTRFEKMVILSVSKALQETTIAPSSSDTLFILSTTKGNINLINPSYPHAFDSERLHLWKSAQVIAQYFQNPNTPLVVSTACISGVSALITGKRLIESGAYKNVIVCGADEVSDFVIAGFNCLKALSPQPCRPYDEEHAGLNLGEGAATMVLSSETPSTSSQIVLKAGVTSNDANHISGPSRTGEGLYRAIFQTLQDVATDDIAFCNAHGTATIFNDDMESIAFHRAALSQVPFSGFKGYFGHTLGAAGLIETVLSAHALEKNLLPATMGYQQQGTPQSLAITTENLAITKRYALKTASGFGGCNAAILLERGTENGERDTENGRTVHGTRRTVNGRMGIGKCCSISNAPVFRAPCTVHRVPFSRITNSSIAVNDEVSPAPVAPFAESFLIDIYRKMQLSYPKFFKMDDLCKLAILSIELLMQKAGLTQEELEQETALVVFNSSSSVNVDKAFQESMSDLPSPSLFVYTLPNVMLGEICIKYKIHGENFLYIAEKFDQDQILNIIQTIDQEQKKKYYIAGYVDCSGGDVEATFMLVKG